MNLIALFVPVELSDENKSVMSDRFNAILHERATSQHPVDVLQHVESKSATLLTHISLMIAVTGVFLALSEAGTFYQKMLGGELIAYLVIAVVCIRCQYQLDQSFYEKNISENEIVKKVPSGGKQSARFTELYRIILGEIYVREKLFKFSFYSVYVLTAILIGTVFLALFGGTPASPHTLGVTK